MLSEIPVLIDDTCHPELNRIFFADYCVDCELNSEYNLELIHLLFSAFDEQYDRQLIYETVRQLNPAVFILAVNESNGRLRRDWPWVSGATLDRIDEHCQRFLGHSQPAHELAVAELLREALSPTPALVSVGALRSPKPAKSAKTLKPAKPSKLSNPDKPTTEF